ncbi:MAG: TadE family protein [Anaerolineales bacterium]|jgi:Flp pilus assembly protein TadG
MDNVPTTLQEDQSSEQGQSLVEFAISLVILVILVSGIVDLGRALFTLITLNDAAKEGATYGSICPTDVEGIFTRLIESASDPVSLSNLTTEDISVCVSVPGSEDCGANVQVGNEITVFVNHLHEISTPFLGSIIGRQNLLLTASARDKILRTTCTTNG